MSYSNQENIKNEHFVKENAHDEKQLVNSNCIVNGSNYVEGEHVPRAGPCEECVCHPPNVVCSMIKCPVNSGCITIQLPNKCCPNYKCGNNFYLIIFNKLKVKLFKLLKLVSS